MFDERCHVLMVSGPKARILARLATFPTSLEAVWDVPRDLSLPGLSECLGVVRSALHSPLNELMKDGLVIERKAHVIGGGTRRRKVYHITELGRNEIDGVIIAPKKTVGELLGNPPGVVSLKGRDDLLSVLIEQEKIILTGLPGIGKTSLLRALADELVKSGKTVRFATMESFKDITMIFEEWGLELTNPDAVVNRTKGEILILDELQETSQRHLARLEMFADKVESLIMASRAPLPIAEGFDIIEIPPLEVVDAMQLLPEHLDDRKMIAERLGGHPLALQLHDEGADLPEAGSDLQNWVEDVVLAGLGDEIVALDELALLPVPVPAENLEHEEMLEDLDYHALLRWTHSGVELHHLVRNVRSTMLSQEDYANAAKYWSTIEGDLARLVEMHHILESEGDIESHLMVNAESLLVRNSAGLATLIGDAIMRHPSPHLHRLAAMVAIERGEGDVASEHLQHCDAPELIHSLAILEGRLEDTDFTNADPRFVLSEAARRMDDRLPGEPPNEDVIGALESIDLSGLEQDFRRVILVAVAHIKHAYYISIGDHKSALTIREGLLSITHEGDSQIQALNMRAEISETSSNSPSFDRLVDRAFQMSGLRAKMLQLSLLEIVDDARAESILNRIELPSEEARENMSSARRVAAMIWYWRAKLKTHSEYSSLAEAASLWRNSLCPKAAESVTNMLHRLG